MTTSTLHRALVHTSAAELERIAQRYAANPNLHLLLPDPAPGADPGERTWARLADEDGVEVWLISWPERAATGWHDHGGSVGAFAVARGAVVEELWDGRAVRRRRLTPGESRAFGEHHVHNVVGVAEGRSVTVHAYAPRLETMTSYALTDAGPVPTGTSSESEEW